MSTFHIRTSSVPLSLEELSRAVPPLGPRSWLALPSHRQVGAYRAAASAAGMAVPANTGVMVLRAIPQQLLALAATADRTPLPAPISATARRFRLRMAIEEGCPPRGYFGRAARTAGFAGALDELIRELKQACVSADSLRRAAAAAASHVPDDSFPGKVEEIGRVYAALEQALEADGLIDEDDLIGAAIQAIGGGVSCVPASLHVAGFHVFTPQQIGLLHALQQAGADVTVHILCDPEREFLFAAPHRTIHALDTAGAVVQEAPPPSTVPPTTAHPAAAPSVPTEPSVPALAEVELPEFFAPRPEAAEGPRPPSPDTLPALERRLFHPAPLPLPVDSAITLLEAPGEYNEAEMIALQIYQLRQREGLSWDSCAIIVRSVGALAPRFRCVFGRYDIPLSASTLEPLLDNPAVQFLVALFTLLPGSWPRDHLLRVLRSSYLGLNLHDADRLERLARREGVLSDPAKWLALAGRVHSPTLQSFLFRLVRWRKDLETPETALDLLARLRRMALSALLGYASQPLSLLPEGVSVPLHTTLSGAAPTANGTPAATRPELSRADRAALRTARHVADELDRHRGRMPPLGSPIPCASPALQPAAVMIGELVHLWQATTFSLPSAPGSTVRLMDAYDVTPREYPVVFVAGLLEGVFPRHTWEDPFLRDEERQALQAHGVSLATSIQKADEERILFYRAISAARERLFLCYPRVSGEGRASLPSFYVDEVRAVVPDLYRSAISRTLADVAPQPHEVVTERDEACAIAVAAGDWRRHVDAEFLARCHLYTAVHRGKLPLLHRLIDGADASLPFVLGCDWTTRDAARQFAVADLESFADCPYKFFAGKRLRLEADRGSLNRADTGTLLHTTIRRFLEELGGQPLPDKDIALDRLHTILDEELDKLRRDAQPYQVSLARLTILPLLQAFLAREESYREATRLTPHHFELSFGQPAGSDAHGELLDAASLNRSLEVRSATAEPVQVYGRMDRVDLAPDGAAAVIDYKLGAGRELKDMESGESLQLPLYFLAMEQVFGLKPAAGFYDSFAKNERKPLVRSEFINAVMAAPAHANGGILPPPRYKQLIDTTCGKVVEIAGLIGERHIAPHPEERKCSLCDFRDLCRA